jgi:hypothetical protein
MAFKKELCKEISLKIFGDPEMVEVGLWAKSEDLYAQGVDKASRAYTIIKRSFLSVAYQSIDGGSFSAYIKRFTTLIESGLMMCIASIPVYGVVIVASLKTTSAFTTLITDSMKSAMLEGSKTAITAIMIKESYTDIVEILLGTCIAPPAAIKKLTIKAAGEEVDQAMIKNMKRPAEFNPFQRQQAAAAAPKDEAGKGDTEESEFYKYIKSLKNRL